MEKQGNCSDSGWKCPYLIKSVRHPDGSKVKCNEKVHQCSASGLYLSSTTFCSLAGKPKMQRNAYQANKSSIVEII